MDQNIQTVRTTFSKVDVHDAVYFWRTEVVITEKTALKNGKIKLVGLTLKGKTRYRTGWGNKKIKKIVFSD